MAACQPCLRAQGNPVLTVRPGERVHIQRGGQVSHKLTIELKPGFHVNSNAPADEYLIPLKLAWAKGALEAEQVIYPKPQVEKLEFSEKPVSIYTGSFDIVTKFKAGADAPPGPAIVNGKLRYQACNNKECLPPKTVDVQLTADIR